MAREDGDALRPGGVNLYCLSVSAYFMTSLSLLTVLLITVDCFPSNLILRAFVSHFQVDGGQSLAGVERDLFDS